MVKLTVMLTAVLLAKNILLPLGVTIAASAADIDLRKKWLRIT